MTPSETLAAAIDKLERLKAESAPGPWGRYADGILMGIESESAAIVYRTVVQAGEVRVADADLIMTLHRTIDAQLAILRSAVDWFRATEAVWRPRTFARHPELGDALANLLNMELALADAILGSDQ